MRRPLAALLLAGAVWPGCHGAAPPPSGAADGRSAAEEAPAPPAASPGGEIVSGLAAPSGVDGRAGFDANAGRVELLAAAREALAERRLDEALSIAEVTILLHGGDAEARELRGLVLEARKEADAAREDFAACCDAGRRTCCERGAPR